ncbi:MAG: hypothetical protein Q4D98_00670 [Planctomycetia bacterium]|nr:hypothetical protein [Planctomycetia bacterium]
MRRHVRRFLERMEHLWFRMLPSFRSVQWWAEHAWSVKTHLLIVVTALILLGISLGGSVFYQRQLSKLSNQFLRLQAFGPQCLFSCDPHDTRQNPFPCFFHIETRSPYGTAIPSCQLELSLRDKNDVPIWRHREKTDANGSLEVDIPPIPNLPERLKLEIDAERGKNTDTWTAYLRAQSWKPAPPPVSLDAIPVEVRPLPDEQSLPVPVRALDKASIYLLERAAVAGTPASVRLYSRTPRKPVLLAVWKNDVLVACRPAITGKSVRNIPIRIPENCTGILEIGLLDYGVSPPELLQRELIFRYTSEEIAARGETLLPALAAVTATFFPPAPLPEPAEQTPETPEVPESPEPSESPDETVEESASLRTLQLLAANTIRSSQEQYAAIPSRELDPLETVLYAAACGEEADAPARKTLMEKVLAIQSTCWNSPENDARQLKNLARRNIPVVYDGLQSLEKEYHRELANYRDRVRYGLGGLVCIILCIAWSLVFLVVMMWMLRIPTGFRVWLATLSLVVVACALAVIIASHSDFDKDSQSVIFQSYRGEVFRP